MSLTTIAKLIRRHQLLPALKTQALYRPFYRLTYVAGAKQCGLLEQLHSGPRSFDELAQTCGTDPKSREALLAWLQLGVHLRLLARKGDRYRLKGLLRTLSRPENDATLALAQEAATLHHKLILETPMKLRQGQLWELADQDGTLTARSSLALETFQQAAIDQFFPATGNTRLLEVGCGSATYIRHAAMRNRSLHAVGMELQPDVAELARANIAQWNLADRVDIEVADIRDKSPSSDFDIVTLYNNIYYFPVDARVALLKHLKGFLKSGGFLLLTSCCQGGNLGMDALNLWGAATAGGGRLPEVAEMRQQLIDAGYTDVKHKRLVPGDSYYAFRATR